MVGIAYNQVDPLLPLCKKDKIQLLIPEDAAHLTISRSVKRTIVHDKRDKILQLQLRTVLFIFHWHISFSLGGTNNEKKKNQQQTGRAPPVGLIDHLICPPLVGNDKAQNGGHYKG